MMDDFGVNYECMSFALAPYEEHPVRILCENMMGGHRWNGTAYARKLFLSGIVFDRSCKTEMGQRLGFYSCLHLYGFRTHGFSEQIRGSVEDRQQLGMLLPHLYCTIFT